MKAPNPGQGYRLLADGERIRATDDWYNGSWEKESEWASKAGKLLDLSYMNFRRRKIAGGWNVTFTTRKAARLAASMSFKEVVLKGPHKA